MTQATDGELHEGMEAILFDLDNTLYPPERQLFALIDRRINGYMTDVVGIEAEDVDSLRRRYWRDYGATLQGLVRHHRVDPEDYLDYVHEIDLGDRLERDEALRGSLCRLGARRFVFTNGSRRHAERVIGALGLEDLFEEIFDIRIARYLPKPQPEPYHSVLDRLGLPGGSCLMVEDSTENLRTAKQLGMRTALVGTRPTRDAWVDLHLASPADLPDVLRGLPIPNLPPAS